METWPANDEYAEFVAAHGRSLLRYAYLVVGNKPDAEDVVQEALVKVARHWHRIQPEGALAYVRKAVTNEALQTRRRARETPTDLASVEIDADSRALLRFEEDQAFFARLQALPQKQRAAVVLRYYVDLSDSAIAVELECAPATVRSQIHRALDHLRQEFATFKENP